MLKTYPGKLLLFGEYTILNGSKALATPFEKYYGRWSYESMNSDMAKSSHQVLQSFLEHESAHFIDQKKLADELRQGLWFDSTIPQGHGVGSSGALVAALYDSFAVTRGNRREDQIGLARLEDYFHGSSSGIDPLVSLIQSPLLIHSFEEVQVLSKKLHLKNFFLLDTQNPRQTGPLVSIYQEKMKDPEFKKGCAEVLSREVNFAIEALLNEDSSHIFHHLWLISKFQWEYFPEMIPTHVRGIWSKGLESGDYILKLCGAGGGGFILGYSDKLSALDKSTIFGSHKLLELK